jgi:hypothetical protein
MAELELLKIHIKQRHDPGSNPPERIAQGCMERLKQTLKASQGADARCAAGRCVLCTCAVGCM